MVLRKHRKPCDPGDHPNKVQISRDVLELENLDPSEVENSTGKIILYFSKIKLKDMHALQKEMLAEIRVRGNTLEK